MVRMAAHLRSPGKLVRLMFPTSLGSGDAEPPPVPAGWQSAVVLVVALAVLCSLMFVGTVRIGRYLRKNRGRML